MNRADEIRELNRLTVEQFRQRADPHLVVLDSLDNLHAHMAESIAEEIRRNNRAALILPYGPTGQYPLLRDIVQRERLSLRDANMFFMDEYADATGQVVPQTHPCSFRGAMQRIFETFDADLRPLASNIVFPDERNIGQIEGMIRDVGGIDVCFGGVGIHGHLAFNEPEPGVRDSGPRLVRLNDFTITMNAIRSHVGGDLENFPRYAFTLGMKQCLSARQIRLYCRNDIPGLDWANTVLRLAVLGQPGDDYPVTWIREHANWQVITDRNTLDVPQCVL